MFTKRFAVAMLAAFLAGSAAASTIEELKKQVADTERAFAATMKARDHAGFVSFLSEEAIFFDGKQSLVGKETVSSKWKSFYDGKDAPFSWEPDTVEVLASGNLALSSGPVYDPTGRQVARFNSIWRLVEPGKWKIVFDRGEPFCGPRKP
ncbi:MAG TPA: nuclear transport factor 2 family protein [Telluria sp.]|nr:nuclear transport factor 2 family protein [Telluria sp.]